MVSVTLTAADIPGADLSELLVLFWHRYREKCLEQARDCDLSCLPSIQNTLNHLGLVPGSLGNRWKKELGSWLGLLPQHVTGMSSILRCSRSYFNRFSLFAHRLYRQVPYGQTPQSHELCNPYGFSHAQVSNRPLPILPFTAILKVTGSLRADTRTVYLIKRYFILFLSPKIKPCDPTWTWKTVLKQAQTV